MLDKFCYCFIHLFIVLLFSLLLLESKGKHLRYADEEVRTILFIFNNTFSYWYFYTFKKSIMNIFCISNNLAKNELCSHKSSFSAKR